MFHRQNEKPESGNVGLNAGQRAHNPSSPNQSAVEIYAKNEKETIMNTSSSNNSQPIDDGESSAPRPIDIPANAGPGTPPGQRSLQQPGSRMPGAFPGSYSSSPASGLYGAVPAKAQQEGRRLVVGEGISLSGEIEACDVLIVEGTIEAALKGAKVLEIAESGVFYGTVQIEEATVAGRFEGDLTVNGRLTIRATGSITGSVAYKELAVEAGAVLDGKVVPLSGSRASEKKPEGRSAQSKKSAPRDSSVNELPFAGSAAISG